MNNVKNQREAGLSGYKNALKEVEHNVTTFLARPPVKPLDVEALNENNRGGVPYRTPPGGVEFMHLRPERRTLDMAREWWESEVAIIETRQVFVHKERVALDEGGHIWAEAVDLINRFEADLRKQMAASSSEGKGKGKARESVDWETWKLLYEKTAAVANDLQARLRIAEERDWKLLNAAIGVELWAFKEAAHETEQILQANGISVPENLLAPPAMVHGESGTTGSHNSFHTVGGGSELLDLPNNHEDEASDSDNEVPQDLLATHDEGSHQGEHQNNSKAQIIIPSYDGAHSDNEIPPEFLAETHDGASSDNEVPPELLVEQPESRF